MSGKNSETPSENAALKAGQEEFKQKLADFLRGKGGGQLGCKRGNFKRKKPKL